MTHEELHDLRDRLADLPTAMREAPRWLIWKSIPNKDSTKKPRKVPYYANGQARYELLDSDADREQLATLNGALSALKNGQYTGLGFALGPDGSGLNWQGIDLDEISRHPELRSLADNLPGYTETSPSGDGLHAIGYGIAFNPLGSNRSGIEAYSSGRFFTVTGESMGSGSPECLASFVQAECCPAHGRIRQDAASPEQAIQDESGFPTIPPDAAQVAELRSALNHLRADDRDLWQNIGHALKTAGDTGRGLFMDWSATSTAHDPLTDSVTWDSFKPSRTNWKHVFTMAQKAGWVNSASKVPAIRSSDALQSFGLVPVHELVNNAKPPQWLIKGVLEADTLGQLFGESGTGKSFVAIDWGCCVATGEPWQGREVKQGSVIYLAGEGHGGLGRRFKAWSRHRGVSLDDAPLFASKTAASLMDEPSAAAVMAAVDEIAQHHEAPALIVVDTLARNLGPGDENSNADVGKFINSLDQMRLRYGSTVLIVHHTGHEAKARARGASCLRAAVDHEYQTKKTNQDSITLTAHKMKEGELPAEQWLEMQQVAVDEDEDGMPVLSAVLITGGKPARREKALSDNQKFALENFKIAAREHGELNEKGIFEGLHLDKWRPAYYSASTLDSDDSKRTSFLRARHDLVKRKELGVKDDVYQLTGSLCGNQIKMIESAIREREPEAEPCA